MGWLTERFRERRRRGSGPLQIMYGIDGRAELTEEVLDHLEGYRGSAPVRIGNGAADQLQLDIYGELIDSVYLYNKYGTPICHDAWEDLCADRRVGVRQLGPARRGDLGDARRAPALHLLAADVAGSRSSARCGSRASAGCPADLVRWMRRATRSTSQIMERGWNARAAGVRPALRHRRARRVVLLMPLVKFISPTDPRWLSTLDAIVERARLRQPRLSLRRRCVARRARAARRARSRCARSGTSRRSRAPAGSTRRGSRFEKMLTYANHLGLYAEEIGPDRRAARELPAGVHAPGADQRGVQPRPDARMTR